MNNLSYPILIANVLMLGACGVLKPKTNIEVILSVEEYRAADLKYVSEDILLTGFLYVKMFPEYFEKVEEGETVAYWLFDYRNSFTEETLTSYNPSETLRIPSKLPAKCNGLSVVVKAKAGDIDGLPIIEHVYWIQVSGKAQQNDDLKEYCYISE